MPDKAPSFKLSAPKSPEHKESVERDPVDETAVIATLHANHDKVVKGEMPASEKLLLETREDLSRLECYPLYKEYVEGTVPTLTTLNKSIEQALANIDAALAKDIQTGTSEEDFKEEKRVRNLIAGRTNSIRRGVDSYVRSIIRFHTLMKLSNGGSRDMKEQFVKADEDRTRAHNNLLESLRILTAQALQAQEEGLLPEDSVTQWTPGMDAKAILEQAGSIVVFSQQTLKDRDYIKDWAIAADFDSQLQDIVSNLESNEVR